MNDRSPSRDPSTGKRQTDRIFPIGSLLLGLGFGLVMLITWLLIKPPAPPAELVGVLRSDFRMLTAFNLQSQKHGPINETSLRGKWSFVFFGYLSCPDACPTTLHELSSFYRLRQDQTGNESDELQVIFVSLDPARDSPGKLASYTTYFNREFIGATAGKGALDRLVGQFGASYQIEAETAPGQYPISHSSSIFLVDPLGRYVASFSQPHYAATLLAHYQRINAYFSGLG